MRDALGPLAFGESLPAQRETNKRDAHLGIPQSVENFILHGECAECVKIGVSVYIFCSWFNMRKLYLRMCPFLPGLPFSFFIQLLVVVS